MKKIREAFLKNANVKQFIEGFDRKDEKMFMLHLQPVEFTPAVSYVYC